MAAPNANETLYNIFELLTRITDEYEEQKNKPQEDQTSSLLKDLLSGTKVSAQAGLGVGQQVSELAKGLELIDKIDISESDVQSVANMFSILATTISGIKLNNKTAQSVYALANAITVLGNINGEMLENIIELNENFKIDNVIKQIKEISTLDAKSLKKAQDFFGLFKGNIGQSLKEFIEAINNFEEIPKDLAPSIKQFFSDLDLKNLPKVTKTAKDSIATISSLLSSFVSMMDKVTLLSAFTLPLKGKIVGKAVTSFFSEIKSSVPQRKIKLELKGIGDLFNGLVSLTEVSSWKLKRTLSKKRAGLVGNFFNEVLKALPDKKKVDVSLGPISELMTLLTEMTFKKYLKLRFLLTDKNGRKIGNFFKSILDAVPKKKEVGTLKPVVEFLSELVKLNIVSLALLKTVITPSFGENLNKFMRNLVKDLDTSMVKKVDLFSKSVNTLSKAMLTMSGSLVLLAGGIAIIGIVPVLASLGIMALYTTFVIYTIKSITAHEKDIKSSVKLIKSMTGFMIGLSASVLALTIAAKLVENTSMESIILVGGMVILMGEIARRLMKSAKIWNVGGGSKALMAMAGLSMAVISVAFSISIISKTVDKTDPGKLIIGVGMLMTTITVMTVLAQKLGNIRADKVARANATLITLTGCLFLSAYTIKMMADLVESYELGTVVAGTAIVLGTMTALVGLTYLVSKIPTKNVTKALITLGAMSLMTIAVGLIIKELFVPIGAYWEEAAAGAVVVLGTIGIMELMVLGLNKIKMTQKQMIANLEKIGIMALLVIGAGLSVLGFAYISQYIKGAGLGLKDFLITGTVLVAVIGGIGGLVYALGYINKKAPKNIMKKGVRLLAELEALALGAIATTFAFTELAETVRGVTARQMTKAGLTIAAVIGGTGLIVYGLGKIIDKGGKNLEMTLAKGAVVLGGLEILALGAVGVTAGFVALAKELQDVDAEAMGKAGLTVAAVLAGTGLLVAGAGALMMIPGAVALAATGAAVLAGLTGIILLITEATVPFCNGMVEIASLSKESIEKGSEITLGILSDFGEMLGVIGVFSPLILAGEVVMTALVGVMSLTGKVTRSYADVLIDILSTNENKGWEGSNLQTGTILVSEMISSYREMLGKFGSFGSIFRSIAFAALLSSIRDTGKTISGYTEVILNTVNSIDKTIVGDFYSLVCGDSEDDMSAMVPAMKAIISQFIDVMPGLLDGFFLDRAIRTTDKILNVVSRYIDVIAKVSTLTYITGYDSNGKPMYEHLEPTAFGDAAKVVTEGFSNFITSLNDGFAKMDILVLLFGRYISNTLNPIIKTVGKFVDVVMKVATGTYIVGYDAKGNPKYEHLTATDFSDAATAITKNFTDFVKTLNNEFKSLSYWTMMTIEDLGKSLMPLMNSIGSFTDAILKLATSTVTITGEDGKNKTVRLDDTAISNAAQTLTSNFISFMNSVITGTKDMKRSQARTIKELSESIAPLMQSVGQFANALMTVASGTYQTGYDKDGRPIYTKITKTQLSEAATAITDNFTTFLTTLVTKTQGMKKKQTDAIKSLASSLGPIMQSVGEFANAIITLASGSYQSGTNPDGTPKYSKLEYDDVKKAAGQVMGYYNQFLKQLLTLAKSPQFQAGGADAMKALGEAVGPVMTSVLDFSKMLIEVMKPEGELTDENGNRKPFKLDVNTIGDAATKIANAYMNFINVLVNKLKDDKELDKNVTAVKGTMSKLAEVASAASEGATSMGSLVKTLGEIKGLDDLAKNTDDSVTKKFVDAMNYLTKSIVDNLSEYDFVKLKNTVIYANNMVVSGVNAVKSFKAFANTINSIERIDEVQGRVLAFIKAIKTLGFNLKRDTIPVPVVYKGLIPFIVTVNNAAKHLKTLANIMNGVSLKDACLQFIEDLTILSDPSMGAKISTVTGSIIKFGTDLTFFIAKVDSTSKTTIKFAKVINKTKEEIETLDEYLINKDKERTEVLERMADKFKDVAEAIKSVKDEIENLDENKILSNFKNINNLLQNTQNSESFWQKMLSQNSNNNVQTPSNQNNNSSQNNRNNNQNIIQNNGQSGTVVNNNVSNINNQNTNNSNPMMPLMANGGGFGVPGEKIMVTFEFKGQAPWTGFMSSKKI